MIYLYKLPTRENYEYDQDAMVQPGMDFQWIVAWNSHPFCPNLCGDGGGPDHLYFSDCGAVEERAVLVLNKILIHTWLDIFHSSSDIEQILNVSTIKQSTPCKIYHEHFLTNFK